MEIVDFDAVKQSNLFVSGEVAATIGGFDGLHRGHMSLIDAVTKCPGLRSTVVTFKQSPASVIRREKFIGNISTISQKLNRIAALKIELVILIDFSLEFSKLTGEQFLEILINRLNINKIVVGFNFHFGFKRGMDALGLRSYCAERNIETKIVPPVMYGDEPISSSRIRSTIRNGDFISVEKMLGYSYIVEIPENISIRKDSDKLVVEKRKLVQVLPDSGNYRVLVNSGEKEYKTEVEIVKDKLLIGQSDNTRVKTILFLK